MLATLEVVTNHPRREETHVHELTVSRLRPARLPISQDFLSGGTWDVHHRSTPPPAALRRLRLRQRLGSRGHEAHVPHAAHRPQTDLRRVRRATGALLRLRLGAPGQGAVRRPATALHPCLRTL